MKTPSMDELQKRYRSLSNSEIEKLSFYEAKDLSSEAQVVLEEEMKKRSIEGNLQENLRIQKGEITEQEFRELITFFSQLPCPICNRGGSALNAARIAVTKSFIFFTGYEESLIIGCPDCIKEKAEEAKDTTSLLGWWGFPWGIIKTFKALSANKIATNLERYRKPTPEFVEFIKFNAAYIKTEMMKIKTVRDLVGSLPF